GGVDKGLLDVAEDWTIEGNAGASGARLKSVTFSADKALTLKGELHAAKIISGAGNEGTLTLSAGAKVFADEVGDSGSDLVKLISVADDSSITAAKVGATDLKFAAGSKTLTVTAPIFTSKVDFVNNDSTLSVVGAADTTMTGVIANTGGT